MNRLTDNKIVLVTRPTRLAELVIRFNTVSQAKFYVEHQGADFSDYLREDETYHRALTEAQSVLVTDGPGADGGSWLPAQLCVRTGRHAWSRWARTDWSRTR